MGSLLNLLSFQQGESDKGENTVCEGCNKEPEDKISKFMDDHHRLLVYLIALFIILGVTMCKNARADAVEGGAEQPVTEVVAYGINYDEGEYEVEFFVLCYEPSNYVWMSIKGLEVPELQVGVSVDGQQGIRMRGHLGSDVITPEEPGLLVELVSPNQPFASVDLLILGATGGPRVVNYQVSTC